MWGAHSRCVRVKIHFPIHFHKYVHICFDVYVHICLMHPNLFSSTCIYFGSYECVPALSFFRLRNLSTVCWLCAYLLPVTGGRWPCSCVWRKCSLLLLIIAHFARAHVLGSHPHTGDRAYEHDSLFVYCIIPILCACENIPTPTSHVKFDCNNSRHCKSHLWITCVKAAGIRHPRVPVHMCRNSRSCPEWLGVRQLVELCFRA